jgi:hypothetical protein
MNSGGFHSQEESFLLFIRRCWRKQLKIELDICDHVVVVHQDSVDVKKLPIYDWLFTAKDDGLVKRKKRDGLCTVSQLTNHTLRVEQSLQANAAGFQRAVCFHTDSSNDGWRELSVIDMQDRQSGSRTLIVVPNLQFQTADSKDIRLLRIVLQKDPQNLFSPPKYKVYLPKADVHKPFPSDYIEFRGSAAYSIAAIQFSAKLVKVMESSSVMLTSLSIWVVACEVGADEHVPLNSPERYKIWLHHIESFDETINSIARDGTFDNFPSKLTRVDRDFTSQASIVKPWTLCGGDFCFFEEKIKESNSSANESARTIERHRPIDDQSLDEDVDVTVDVELEGDCEPNTKRDAVPNKCRRVTMKWIEQTRDEMNVLERLDASLPRSLDDELVDNLQVRIAVEDVWPLNVASWFFSDSGRENRVCRRKSDNNIDNDFAANKRFSYTFINVNVCEMCYFVYTMIKQHRKGIERRKELELKEIRERSLGTIDQRRDRDRNIERQMFQQRRLATRLSKCKSAPSEVETIDRAQRPLDSYRHWKISTRHNGILVDKSHSRSIAEHILNRKITKQDLLPTNDPFQLQWELAIDRKPALPSLPLPKLRPAISNKEKKPVIDTTNYDALRLLHPWQRELQQLKQEKGKSVVNPTKICTDDEPVNYMDEEDDDEAMGWNPFVL